MSTQTRPPHPDVALTDGIRDAVWRELQGHGEALASAYEKMTADLSLTENEVNALRLSMAAGLAEIEYRNMMQPQAGLQQGPLVLPFERVLVLLAGKSPEFECPFCRRTLPLSHQVSVEESEIASVGQCALCVLGKQREDDLRHRRSIAPFDNEALRAKFNATRRHYSKTGQKLNDWEHRVPENGDAPSRNPAPRNDTTQTRTPNRQRNQRATQATELTYEIADDITSFDDILHEIGRHPRRGGRRNRGVREEASQTQLVPITTALRETINRTCRERISLCDAVLRCRSVSIMTRGRFRTMRSRYTSRMAEVARATYHNQLTVFSDPMVIEFNRAASLNYDDGNHIVTECGHLFNIHTGNVVQRFSRNAIASVDDESVALNPYYDDDGYDEDYEE